jgi:hypothetical protein
LANLSLQKESSKERLEKITKIERPSTSVQDKYNHFNRSNYSSKNDRGGNQSQNDFYRKNEILLEDRGFKS